MLGITLGFLIAFLVGCIVLPLLIRAVTKKKAGQPILGYVDNHKKKEGTPTFGGLAIIFAVILATLAVCRGERSFAFVAIATLFGYGTVGFLDDFLKVRFKKNEGLKAYQKIFAQLVLASIIAVYAYRSNLIGTSIVLPFASIEWNISFWVIPLVILVMLATTNCVNLTDGLDGLASTTTICYLIIDVGIIMFSANKMHEMGVAPNMVSEYKNICIFAACMLGATLAFLFFNCNPAKIFMGDTGSLALGGGIGIIAVCTKTMLFVPVLGIMFVVSGISVIVQVAYFKMTKKRIFLMAPFHHHLERKGLSETRISTLYAIITVIFGVTLLCVTVLVKGY